MTSAVPPRIGLDITQAVKRRGRGIARYIRQVTPPLAAAGLDARLVIRGHRWWRRSLVADLAPSARRCWMPLASRLPGGALELFHGFGNHLPRAGRIPLTMTVHDVRALDRPAGYEGRDRLLRNLHRATGVICLTAYGRDRLVHNCPEWAERVVHVVPHGVDHRLFRPPNADAVRRVRERYALPGDYLLQLGSWFPHKNLELSLRALAASRAGAEGVHLVFAGGGAPDDYRRSLDEIVGDHGLHDRVHWLDHVPGVDLPALLGGAQALLQPSRYEGFALPLLEAMATGLPGVVSDAACLPEVSAGLWPVAGMDDVEGFAAGIDRMVLDAAAREQAIADGLHHARQFTWERTAALTADFFRAVLAA